MSLRRLRAHSKLLPELSLIAAGQQQGFAAEV
jgi:hypothetical protein